ncbi:alpha/beta hydrolase [Clostridium perfringens]
MEALTGESNFENYERIDELSTIKYITPNYPSTFITVGDIDPFVYQGKELASSLRALGVKVVSRFFENKGLWHEYQFKFSVKEARETFKSVIEFLNDNSKSMN